MVVDGEVERERFSFSLNFQFRREHFYIFPPYGAKSVDQVVSSSPSFVMMISDIVERKVD